MFSALFNRKHHRIVLGAPILFLFLAASNQTVMQGNILELKIIDSPYVEEGSSFKAELLIDEKTSVNAIGGAIIYPTTLLSAKQLITEGTVIDLWAESPYINKEKGKIFFSGGITSENGFTGKGKILTIEFETIAQGKGKISIDDAQLLAHDGSGTSLSYSMISGNFITRKVGAASPDVNQDGMVSFIDIQQTYLSSFRPYNQKYDMNHDGRNSWADVRIVVDALEIN